MDQSLSRSSSSSGIDIAGNRAGFIASNAMSPQPSPKKFTFGQPRKRNSWGHQDNLNPFYSPQPSQPQSSSSSLIQDEPYSYLNDDPVAHLTNEEDDDPERQRRRTVRYSMPQSPLKKTGTAIKQVSTNIRRVSLRVVNMTGTDAVRLPDDEKDADVLPDLSKARPIRGRTLGFLGPDSKLRLSLYRILLNPWTEPTILVLIITHAIVLTIQSSRSLNLPSTPTAVSGYFQFWEDWVLLGLFVLFTVEAFARIAVSGFLLDPEIPTSALFTSIFSSATPTSVPVQPPTTPNVPQSASVTVTRSLSNRFETLQRNLKRPFELSEHTRRPSEPEMTNKGEKANKGHTSNPSLILREASYSSSIFPPPLVNATTTPSKAPNTSSKDLISLPFTLSISLSHSAVNRHIPYLRRSWSRIDFISIVSFWVSFALATLGYERGHGKHIAVFRALSVIRTARLLGITSGTTTIMHSLKTARPLLASVAYFVLFAMVLFSIIGMQSFKGSLRRTCHLLPTLGEPDMPLTSQFCGGYIDPATLNPIAYIDQSGANVNGSIKGYVCPLGQQCREQSNPNNDIESFDTIYFAALQVIVVASANGWTPLMYSMIDSEFFISCFFFIICVIVLNFWLINLFVAVITNTFSAIRSVTKKSAFGADRGPNPSVDDDHDDGWDRKAPSITQSSPTKNVLRKIIQFSQPFFVLLALTSLVLQSTRSVDIGDNHQAIMFWGELIITILFDVEIVTRFLATLPEWRAFVLKKYERPGYTYAASTPTFSGSMASAAFKAEDYGYGSQGRNVLDTVLAVVTTIIQIPFIRNSQVYPWFTIFQLVRFYRVILVVPRMKPLLLAVFGNMYGLANMSLFLLLVNYIAALVAIQLLRGDLTPDNAMNFGQVFTSFLAIYQVFSSENWTDVMYGAASAEISLGQSAIVVIFIAGWMLFANFIVLQMFIAVINENFTVAEESKKGQQANDYWESHNTELLGSGVKRPAWIKNLNPYRWVKANPDQVKVESLPSGLVLRMQKDIVGIGGYPRGLAFGDRPPPTPTGPRHYHTKSLTMLQRLFGSKVRSDDVPMTELRHVRNETPGNADTPDEETERHLELLAAVHSDAPNNQELNDTLYERRAQKADFIRDHPTFDKTFWIFSQNNQFRRWCQKLVQPANGERIFGTPPSPIAHPIFQLVIFLAVAGGIAVESVATPGYRRKFFAEHGKFRGAWFDVAEAAFGLTLVVEFLIKIGADGFLFTPNAYIRSIWNVLDLTIMVGLLINVTTSLIFIGGLSRLTRSLKALRALRLITLMDIMRSTFKSLIISGALRILDAAVLAILYMIPYAVWGLNIFAGKMNQCNDNSVSGASDCVNEFTNTVYGNSFGFLAPRVWDNPAPSTVFSFDTFRASLLILFEIVSLEGWIDVMNVATSITGAGQQPQTNASQANALFFLIYNLLGGVVILTLFISIIIGNFSSKTGTAFLTKPQREWIDLQKLFKRQKPSKRPAHRPSDAIRAWCFDRAIHKHGWWSRTMTVLFVLHIIALMTQTFAIHTTLDAFRNDFFLAITFAYIIDVLVRFTGLGYHSFKANGWNIFDAIVAVGSFGTSLAVRFASDDANNYVLQQMQKLFLVSIAFKLVQRTNSLNQLFKTAVASLPVIVSLIGLWLILFLFFAILFVEVFGMTKWGSGENRNQNYSSIGTALVMLAFMSTGEGWNQYMHDYALVYPRCTNVDAAQADSDCGSIAWAFTLFIAWNLLSMYIFVNMFTGVVVENFSYVFQTSAGGAKSITREEMRSFKKIWGEFANPKTGLLERRDLVKFFGRLNGAFEVRIYPSEYNVRKITAACRSGPVSAYSPLTPRPKGAEGMDLNKLDQILSSIDYSAVRRRRNIYVRLLNEANLESRRQHRDGITFTGMLMLLAHHKLIVDHEALNLKDLVARTEINKLVTDLVNLDRVRSLLTTISYRRRFLAHLQNKRRTMFDSPAVPHIVVDSIPSTPPAVSKDIASMGYDSVPSSPTPPVRSYHYTPDGSLSIDTTNASPGSALQRSSRRHWRTSDASMLSADLGIRSPRDSLSDEDPQNVLSSIQNSMWRDLMSEAMEEAGKADK